MRATTFCGFCLEGNRKRSGFDWLVVSGIVRNAAVVNESQEV